MNYRLLVLLEKVLGKGRPTSGNNIAFYSPFCSHHKPKLEINLETIDGKNPWHCWISNEKGKTIHSLFKKLKVDKNVYVALNECVENNYIQSNKKDADALRLPDEFKPLTKLKKEDLKLPEIKHALLYLNQRNISVNDIKRYNIGVCISGDYKNRIIIPSYDDTGNLNYFVSRTFLKNEFIKYKNPKVVKTIIPFDLYINWELPIYLVEGVFDAIAVKFNAIPLLGKSLSDSIKKKIIEKKPPCVYVALDSDAKKDALRIIKTIASFGIPVYYADIKDKDPSEMGHSCFFNHIKKSNVFTNEDLLKLQLSL
jgi:DNA primase